MPHDSSVPRPFISDCDPGDETDVQAAHSGNSGAPYFSEPPRSDGEKRVGIETNGSSNGHSALARNRAPFPAGF